MSSNFRAELRQFILENYLFTDDQTQLSDDSSFLDEGVLDSMGMMELIDFLGEQFKVTVEDDEMIPDNLDSIDNLVAFVTSKLA